MRVRVVATLAVATLASGLHAQAPSLSQARQLFDARNYDAARSEYVALAKTLPNDPTPSLYLGRIALVQNDDDEAIRQLERCAEINERLADCHAYLGDALGNAAQHTNKLKLPFLAKRTKREFDRAVELDPGSIEGRMGELQYYLYAPGFLGGSADKAREQAAEMDKRNKLHGALAYGMVADHENNKAEAEAALQRAVAAAPDSAIGYNSLVNFYAREKRWAEAFTTLDMERVHVPPDANVDLSIARVAYLSGEQLPRGEEAAKRWIANPPKGATTNALAAAHIRLANIYDKTNRRDLARVEYEKALSINPKSEEAKKALENLKS